MKSIDVCTHIQICTHGHSSVNERHGRELQKMQGSVYLKGESWAHVGCDAPGWKCGLERVLLGIIIK